MPPDTNRLDFELEVAAVICRDVRNATPEQAKSAIGGYRHERLVGPGRAGPGDEARPRPVQGQGLRHHHRAVGRHRGRARRLPATPTASSTSPWRSGSTAYAVGADRSAHMGWSFEQMVSYASRASWVKAGEVLASGTCAGGALAETWGRTGSLLPPPLQVGDVVSMTIERLGTIRNQIVASSEEVPRHHPGPPSRFAAQEMVLTLSKGQWEPYAPIGPGGGQTRARRPTARVLPPRPGIDLGRRRGALRVRGVVGGPAGRAARRCCAGSAGSSPNAARSTPP